MSLYCRFCRAVAMFSCTVAAAMAATYGAAAEAQRPNVLFIAVDDLRPQLGCYGDGLVKSPHIDRLAAGGLLFERAYCQQAVCSPSRTSLLTGRRPDTTRIYELQTHFRRTIPDVVTLPEHFKQNGYHTQSLGKIYHGGLDDPQSWSVKSWTPSGPGYGKPETLAQLNQDQRAARQAGKDLTRKVVERDSKSGLALKVSQPGNRVRGPAWEDPDVADNALPDGQTADKAVEVLRAIKDRPFFLAVGFLKPHLPFVAPKKYFDLYPLEDIKPADNPYPPRDVPQVALTSFGELRSYRGMPKQGPLGEEQARELIRGYYAASSYTDAQIGRVLDELERLGLAGNTIVVLWGDHGWQLGEHGLWCKHTNFELAARAPLILRVPGKRAGARSAALVEFVDIYPTLCELCGLTLTEGLEGTSLVPLLVDPTRRWKTAAFSQYPRGKVMGYSMKTDRYRYTEWREADGKAAAVELYDHQADPAEDVNLAGQPGREQLAAELRRQLKGGWRAAVPERP